MPGEVDISALLGGQTIVDETDLPDAGGEQDDGSDLETEIPGGQQTNDLPPEEPEVPVTGKRNPKVPLAALQEERTKRQELQDQLRAQTETQQRLEQRTNLLLQQIAQNQQMQQQQLQQQQPPAQIPSFTEDPEGHVAYLRQEFENRLAQLGQQSQVAVQQQQAAAQQQQLAMWASSQEQAFSAKQTDYKAAADFFGQRKTAEYTAMGLDPVSVQSAVARDYQSLAMGAYQTNRNPAELMYNLAKAMGYAPQKAGAGQGGVKVPAGPKQAPTSLSNIEGTRSPDEESELTAESLANMTDAEFDKLWAKMAKGSKQGPRF